jgi:hypothetical protein
MGCEEHGFPGGFAAAEPEIIFFPNGNTAVLRNGEQQPDLQRPWLVLFAEFLASRGEDPTKFRCLLPNGGTAKMIRTKSGWTWEFDE